MSQSTNLSQMNTVASAPSQKSSQIPDLLKIGAIPSETDMDVLTDILDPVVHNDNYVRFAFQNKGILHSHSKLQLAVSVDAAQPSCMFPLATGVYNLVDRVRFSIGSKTVSEIQDFNFFMGYKTIFMSQEAMKEREQYLTSRIMNYGFEYKDQELSTTDASYTFGWDGSNPSTVGGAVDGTIAKANAQANFLTIDNGIDGGVVTQGPGVLTGTITQFMSKAAADTGGGDNPNAKLGNGLPIYKAGYWMDLKRESADTEPTFQLSLADLVPFLKTQQIPLYLLDELVTLELFFTPKADRLYAPGRVAADAQALCSIKTSETKMIADYLFYPNDIMVSYANANRNLQFNYMDYTLSKYSLNDGNKVPSGQLIRNIGGAGRMVNRIFFGVAQVSADPVGDLPVRGVTAFAPERNYANVNKALRVQGKATINLKYNDTFLFPIDVDNNARHFHNTASAEGITPSCVPRDAFSGEGELITTGSLNCATSAVTFTGPPASNPLSTLSGKFFYPAMKMMEGQRVNSRGLELYMTWSDSVANTNGYVQRVWLECMKSLQLTNGRVSISYA